MDNETQISTTGDIPQDVTETKAIAAGHGRTSAPVNSRLHDDVSFDDAASPAVTTPPIKTKPMRKRRFASGLAIATTGIGLMLFVAMGALRDVGADGHFSLPAVALCMIIGLMMLGGGFGIMATAAPKFDDDEFERLMRLGNDPDVAEPEPIPIPQASPVESQTETRRNDSRSSLEKVAV